MLSCSCSCLTKVFAGGRGLVYPCPRAISPITGTQLYSTISFRDPLCNLAELQHQLSVHRTVPYLRTSCPVAMGTFSGAVASLLDTYSKCLSLLKTFRGSGSGGDADANPPFANLQPSLLGTSLRSDQASIRRAYSSRLSQNGARLEKGDGESILSSCICKLKKIHLARASKKNACLQLHPDRH
jgi:hypothetical protein